MAIAFLTLNGVGLGHLVRATSLCRVLESVGERPVVFSQGILPLDEYGGQPSRFVPTLWKADEATRLRVASDLASFALLSQPAVVVEDTHPNPIRLPSDVRRVLVVRPTTFEYLTGLQQGCIGVFQQVLVADHEESPTWPYTAAETADIQSWAGWEMIGPVYRASTTSEVEAIRHSYGIAEGSKVCVFSMGGGGQQQRTDPDVVAFMSLATRVAEEIHRSDPAARCIFVCGPYFPSEMPIGSGFEVVDSEPNMPALLAAAHGAVIRAGFNTTWECLVAGTPFLPFVGTNYAEPTALRVERLRARDLLGSVGLPMTFWNDERFRTRFRRQAANAVRDCPGSPDPDRFREPMVGRQPDPPNITAASRWAPHPSARRTPSGVTAARRRVGWPRRTVPMAVRIDDVVGLDAPLVWLLAELRTRQLRASLEVIPYLTTLDDSQLDDVDPLGDLLDVSQHGYAHIPRVRDHSARFEFDPSATLPTPKELRDLTWGRAELTGRLPHRFRNGLSPPFDAMPTWLPSAWRDLGGEYVSTVSPRQGSETSLPIVHAGAETWNWAKGVGRKNNEVTAAMRKQHRAAGHVGIVINARCLRSRCERARFIDLLDFWTNRGVTSALLSEISMELQAQRTPAPTIGPAGV